MISTHHPYFVKESTPRHQGTDQIFLVSGGAGTEVGFPVLQHCDPFSVMLRELLKEL